MKIDHRSIKKICVIQLQPFGDVFLTTSYFKALKEFYPRAELTYLMKEPFHLIVKDHPYIDRIISIKKQSGLAYLIERLKTFRRVRNEKFDLVIDQQFMPSSQVIAYLSGARYRIGYKSGFKNLFFLYNIFAKGDPSRYSAVQKFDIVKPLGMKEKPCKLFFHIPAESLNRADAFLKENGVDPEKAILISPGTKMEYKKWPAEGFAKAASLLQEKGYRIVLICAPSEEKDVAAVVSHMKNPPVVDPPSSLQDAAALIHRIPLFICNDGAINHLSVAVGNKTIAIFGISSPASWSPASVFKSHRHMHNPHFKQGDPFFGITPEELVEEAVDFLNAPK
jgi:ADP-heptose:LPS heptosyltransferase